MDNRLPLPQNYSFDILDYGPNNNTYSLTIDKEVGRGGSCIAYSGIKNDTKQKVIIKEFYPHNVHIPRDNNHQLSLDNASKQSFDEKLMLFKEGIDNHTHFYNNDPNSVLTSKICDGYANNTYYVVYLQTAGRTLSNINLNQIKIEDAIKIAISICDAIKSIHRDFKVYLDCKPDNIIVNNDNHALLFDFDTVLDLSDFDATDIYISCSNGYAAPEQDHTTHRVNPLDISYYTDIYSIGATFFYVLTGHKPSEEDITNVQNNTFNWRNNIINSNFRRLKPNKDFIDLLNNIIKMALEPDFTIRSIAFDANEPCESINILENHLFRLYIFARGNVPEENVRRQYENLIRLSKEEHRKTRNNQDKNTEKIVEINKVEHKKSRDFIIDDGDKTRSLVIEYGEKNIKKSRNIGTIIITASLLLAIVIFIVFVIIPNFEKKALESTYLKNQSFIDTNLGDWLSTLVVDKEPMDISFAGKINSLSLFWDGQHCIVDDEKGETVYAKDTTAEIESFEDIVIYFPKLRNLYIYNIHVPNEDENGGKQLSCLRDLKYLESIEFINCAFYNREALPSELNVEIDNSILTGEWKDQTLKTYFENVEEALDTKTDNGLYFDEYEAYKHKSLAINMTDTAGKNIYKYHINEGLFNAIYELTGKKYEKVTVAAHELFMSEAETQKISTFEDLARYFPNLETLIIYNADLPNEDTDDGKQYSSLLELKNLKYVEFINCNFTNLSALKNVDEVVINNGTNFSTEKFVPGEFRPEEISIDCNGNFYFMRSYKKGESLVDRLSFYYELDDGTFNNKYRIITNDFSRKFPGTRSLYCCGCEFVDENGLKENTISFDNFSNLERLKLKKCDVALTPKVPPYVEVLCIDNQQNNNSLYGELAFKDLLKSSSLSALELKYFKNIDFHEAENNKQLDIISISDCSFDESTLGEAKYVFWLEIESNGLVQYNSKKLVNSIKQCIDLHKLVFRNIDFTDCTDELFDSLRMVNNLHDLSIPYCILKTTKPFASFETKITRLDVTGIMTLKSDNSNGRTFSREYNFYYLKKFKHDLSPENFLYTQGVDFDSEYPPDIIN